MHGIVVVDAHVKQTGNVKHNATNVRFEAQMGTRSREQIQYTNSMIAFGYLGCIVTCPLFCMYYLIGSYLPLLHNIISPIAIILPM